MDKLWAVVQREFLERVRTKWFVISTVFAPIAFAALLFVPAWLSLRNSSSNSAADIVIIDATGAGLGRRVVQALHTAGPRATEPALTGNTQLRVIDPAGRAEAERVATREVMQKRTQGFLVLDEAAVRGDSASYVGRNASSAGDTQRIQNAVRQAALAVRLERAGLDPARVDSITRPRLQLGTERLSERGRGGSGRASMIFAVAVAFLLYTSILLYGQNVLRSVIEEKQTRVAEVVVSSVKPSTLLAGKVIGVGAVGIVQQIIWVVSTAYLGSWIAPFLIRMGRNAAAQGGAPAGAVPPGGSGAAMAAALPNVSFGSIALILLFFLLGFLFYSSLYAAVGSTVNSEQEAQQAVGPIMILVIGSAVMIQPVVTNPTSALARVASMLPFSAPIIMPMRMSLTSVPPVEMGIAIGGLVVACVAAVWLAARIYRVGLLMYGKRPTLRELVRWVRYAR
jgi:ABC-2 type transport system permease protein